MLMCVIPSKFLLLDSAIMYCLVKVSFDQQGDPIWVISSESELSFGTYTDFFFLILPLRNLVQLNILRFSDHCQNLCSLMKVSYF